MSNQESDQADSKLSQIIGFEDYPAIISFRSFRNPDSTWGFPIFVNNRPYLPQKRIPVSRAVSGFQSKLDAKKVASLFVKIIRNSNLTSELNRKAIDSLEIIIRFNE